MLRKMPILLLPVVLLLPAPGQGAEARPSNFDECIIDAMRGVSSDVAARAIIESCRNLFPDPQPDAAPAITSAPAAVPAAAPAPVPAPAEDAPAPAAVAPPAAPKADTAQPVPLDTAVARSLTDDELARLNARAKVFGSTYRVTVDNGNPGLTLTEVTIAVWDDGDSAASRKEYSEEAQIAPQSSGMITYTVHYRGDETGWNWGVVAARGVE